MSHHICRTLRQGEALGSWSLAHLLCFIMCCGSCLVWMSPVVYAQRDHALSWTRLAERDGLRAMELRIPLPRSRFFVSHMLDAPKRLIIEVVMTQGAATKSIPVMAGWPIVKIRVRPLQVYRTSMIRYTIHLAPRSEYRVKWGAQALILTMRMPAPLSPPPLALRSTPRLRVVVPPKARTDIAKERAARLRKLVASMWQTLSPRRAERRSSWGWLQEVSVAKTVAETRIISIWKQVPTQAQPAYQLSSQFRGEFRVARDGILGYHKRLRQVWAERAKRASDSAQAHLRATQVMWRDLRAVALAKTELLPLFVEAVLPESRAGFVPLASGLWQKSQRPAVAFFETLTSQLPSRTGARLSTTRGLRQWVSAVLLPGLIKAWGRGRPLPRVPAPRVPQVEPSKVVATMLTAAWGGLSSLRPKPVSSKQPPRWLSTRARPWTPGQALWQQFHYTLFAQFQKSEGGRTGNAPEEAPETPADAISDERRLGRILSRYLAIHYSRISVPRSVPKSVPKRSTVVAARVLLPPRGLPQAPKTPVRSKPLAKKFSAVKTPEARVPAKRKPVVKESPRRSRASLASRTMMRAALERLGYLARTQTRLWKQMRRLQRREAKQFVRLWTGGRRRLAVVARSESHILKQDRQRLMLHFLQQNRWYKLQRRLWHRQISRSRVRPLSLTMEQKRASRVLLRLNAEALAARARRRAVAAIPRRVRVRRKAKVVQGPPPTILDVLGELVPVPKKK